MSSPLERDDVRLLARRIDNIARTAENIRRHLPDLHACAYEPATRDELQIRSSQTDHTPRAGDPRAQHLWSSISLRVIQVEKVLIGLERQLMGYFYAGSTNPETTRGSLIALADHNQLLANQRRRRAGGEYTPAPLTEQPRHPGANR